MHVGLRRFKASRLRQLVLSACGGGKDVLEKMQPKPVPLLEMPSQHARTWGELHDGSVAWEEGTGLGRADAAMATERTLSMVLNCILVVGGFEA